MAKKKRRESRSTAAIARLPQVSGEVWQADVCRLPVWVTIAGEMQRPWMVIVVNQTDDLVLAHEATEAEPSSELLWEKLAEAMASFQYAPPHRPAEVQLRSEQLESGVRAKLDAIGVKHVFVETLDQLDLVLQGMAKHLGGGRTVPALADVPGLDNQQIRSYFEAAASFYKRSPWRHVPGDTPIRVECSTLESGPWYAFVMGQYGMTYGLALHEDLEALKEILASDLPEQAGHHTSAISLMYGEQYEISPRDLDAIEEHGWEIAGPNAYPLALRVNPGRALRPPLVWELQLLEACLWAIPDFVDSESETARMKVPVVSEQMKLVLSWTEL